LPIALIFFFVNDHCLAQQKFQKIIVEDIETSNPIDGASIYYSYTNIEKKKEYSYKLTGSDGNAQIEVPKLYPQSTIYIKCSHISYETEDVEVLESIFSNEVIYVRLTPRTRLLDSITIKSNRYSLLDTIHINVDTTRLHLSNKLIEQLKRDNRFSVSNNSISFRGKLISKVILDNMDLNGNNYMSLLEQLKAESFESLDVIQNYHDNSLENGFVEPEVAIKINSKNNSKQVGAVNAKVDFSNVHLNQLNLNGYSLSEKIKTYGALGRTRLGQTINRPVGAIVVNTGNFWEDSDVSFPHYIFQVPNLPIPYTSFSKLSEALIQTVFRVSNKSTNRIFAYYGNLTNNQEINLLNQVTIDNTIYRFDIFNENMINTSSLSVENEYKYSNKRDFVKAEVKILLPDENFTHLQKFTGNIEDLMADKFTLNKSKTADLNLIYSHLIAQNILFEYNLKAGYKYFKEQHTFQSERAMSLFRTKLPVFDSIGSEIRDLQSYLALKSKVGRISIIGEIGYTNEGSKRILVRKVSYSNSTNISNNDNFYNNLSVYLRNLLSFELQKLPVKFTLDSKVSQIRSNILFDSAIKNTDVYYGYKLDYKMDYRIGNSIGKDISVDLTYNKEPLGNRYLMPLNFITEEYLFNSGILTRPFTEKLSSTIRFHKQKVLDPIPINVGITYTYNIKQSIGITQRDLLAGYYYVGATFGKSFNAFGDLTYKFLFTPLKIKFTLAEIHNSGKFVLNNEYIDVSSQYTNIGSDLEWKKRNWALGCLLSWSSSLSKSRDFVSNDIVFRISPSVIFITNNERFKIEIKYSNYNYIDRSSIINVLDMDFNFNLWKKFKFTLYGVNLLNLTKYEIINLSDYTFTQSVYSINPLQIGLRADVDLF